MGLKARLEQVGFRVFLDQTEYVPGVDLRRETLRQVKKSRKLVVVGRPSALRSKWVKREVDLSLQSGKTPVLINVNHAVECAEPDAGVAAMAIESHWLHLDESLSDQDADPSEQTIAELIRGFKYTRQKSRRLSERQLSPLSLRPID